MELMFCLKSASRAALGISFWDWNSFPCEALAGCFCSKTLPFNALADVDYVTALCSQVVYEGLVDDTFRIKCGNFPLPLPQP